MQLNTLMKRRRKGTVTFVRSSSGCRLNPTYMHDMVCLVANSELDGLEKQFHNHVVWNPGLLWHSL